MPSQKFVENMYANITKKRRLTCKAVSNKMQISRRMVMKTQAIFAPSFLHRMGRDAMKMGDFENRINVRLSVMITNIMVQANAFNTYSLKHFFPNFEPWNSIP